MMQVRFLEPNSPEFRDLLYERLRQIIVGLREGLYSEHDLYYVVTSLVALGDLSEEEAKKLLKNPTLATLDTIFGKREPRTIYAKFLSVELPEDEDAKPCIVVVPNREVATKLLERYSWLVPIERFRPDIEYGICSIYKAISLVATRGFDVKTLVLLPDDFNARTVINFEAGEFRTCKHLRGYVALLLIARLYNIKIYAPKALKFDFEMESTEKTLESASGRIGALLQIMKRLSSGSIISIKTPIDLSEYLPAICVAFINRYGIARYDPRRGAVLFPIREMTYYDRDFYDLLNKVCYEVPDEVNLVSWWTFGEAKQTSLDHARYELARNLGFDEKIARKIASWRVNSLNDIVRLLKDLRFNYRDEKYFREVVIPKIAQIFNTTPEALTQLLELL